MKRKEAIKYIATSFLIGLGFLGAIALVVVLGLSLSYLPPAVYRVIIGVLLCTLIGIAVRND